MFGILNLDKPVGFSSAKAVDRVKKLIPRTVKIGHAGTLDPFATGVLLLLVGKATRLCESLMDSPKQYEATVRFGETSDTDDPTGHLQPYAFEKIPTLDQITAALPAFIGEVEQLPPTFSALRIGGHRAYALARAGKPVPVQPRKVKIYNIELISYVWPDLAIRIDCGRGVYIRSIARDLGKQLDAGGHLHTLRRTKVGRFDVNDSQVLANLTKENVEGYLQGLELLPPEGDRI